MRRSDFKGWGKELTEESFWQAVAAVGVSRGFYPGVLRGLEADMKAGRALRWLLHPDDLPLRETPVRPQNWRHLIHGRERQDWPRLEVDAGTAGDLGELLEGLLGYAASSLYVVLPETDPGAPWLPKDGLRVGFLPGAPSVVLREGLGRERASRRAGTIHLATVGAERSFDLLVIPAPLARAREVLASSPVVVRATVLLLLGGRALEGDTLRQVGELRSLTRARAVACASLRAGKEAEWLATAIERMTKGVALDLAIQAPDLLAEDEPAFLFAERGLMAGRDERVTGFSVPDYEWSKASEPPPEEVEFSSPPGTLSVPASEEDLVRSPPRSPIYRATDASRAPEGRFLQARILERGTAVRSLQSDRTYDVAVRIGSPERSAVVADRGFPEDELPDQESHLLTVVFSEPHLLEAPQVETILLPRSGPSTLCTFELPVRRETRSVSARLTVLYENRVLQAALLRGRVGQRLSLTVEMVVRPEMKNLSRQRPFDGALILNQADDGVARATVAGGYRPATFSVVGLEEAIEAMEAQINGTPWDDPAFASFDSPGSVELLLFLACHGERLYKELLRYAPDHPFLTGDGPVQLISTEHGTRLPLEFLYNRTAPNDDAGLCPNWREALATGVCDCPDDGSVVCPLGFWCFRRVIERHRFSPDHAKETEGRAYALRDVPPGEDGAALQPLAGVVLGASRRVGAVAGTLEGLTSAVERTFARPIDPADDWDDWAKQVQALSPSLLVLLPHTEKNARFLPTLEIGGAPLAASKLGRQHVIGPKGEPKPVVLLLGCNTDNAGLPFESFVPAFADRQAAVVVTSISRVLGRHAAPLAALFLEQLAAFPQDGSHRFGEVMREVRRRAALAGPPLALVLKAYGDADWRI